MSVRRKSSSNAAANAQSSQTKGLKIVCISDTHGYHRHLNVPEGDILVHAGDFMANGRSMESLRDFNDWLGSLPHPHRIVIAGNHDLLFEAEPRDARAAISNAVYLENSGVALEGLNFWGCPATPVLRHMAFAVERGAASRKLWDRVPDGTDVLITHGPPFRVLDQDDIAGEHLGCQELTRAVLRAKPRLHIFGHAHGGYGQETGPNNTWMVNCALLARVGDGRLGLREPIIVELERGARAPCDSA